MEEKGKHRTLLSLVVILILICLVQFFLLIKTSDVTFSWGKAKDNNFDIFSQSFLDKYQNDKKNHGNLFDQFFDDDFFRSRNNPFQEKEDMQRRMREMMEKDSQGSFNDSWDRWFSRRFYKKGNTINIHTQEEKDSFIVTIRIPNLKENNLNVTVDNSGVHIQAEVEQLAEKKDQDGNVITSSKLHRKIDQTFPIPHNADYEKAQLDHKKDKVIITLPKLS